MAATDEYDDGWARTGIILKPRQNGSTSGQRRVIQEGVREKDGCLARLASTVAVGDGVALGVAASEREAKGVDFYLGRVSLRWSFTFPMARLESFGWTRLRHEPFVSVARHAHRATNLERPPLRLYATKTLPFTSTARPLDCRRDPRHPRAHTSPHWATCPPKSVHSRSAHDVTRIWAYVRTLQGRLEAILRAQLL